MILCAQRLRFPAFKNRQFVEREGIQNMTLWCEPERLVGGRLTLLVAVSFIYLVKSSLWMYFWNESSERGTTTGA